MARYALTDAPRRIAYDRTGARPRRGKLTVANNSGAGAQVLRPIRVHRAHFASGDRVGTRLDAGVVMSDDLNPWQGEWYAVLDDGTAGPYIIDVDDEPENA